MLPDNIEMPTLGDVLDDVMYSFGLDKLVIIFNPFLTGEEGNWVAEAHRNLGTEHWERWKNRGETPGVAFRNLLLGIFPVPRVSRDAS